MRNIVLRVIVGFLAWLGGYYGVQAMRAQSATTYPSQREIELEYAIAIGICSDKVSAELNLTAGDAVLLCLEELFNDFTPSERSYARQECNKAPHCVAGQVMHLLTEN